MKAFCLTSFSKQDSQWKFFLASVLFVLIMAMPGYGAQSPSVAEQQLSEMERRAAMRAIPPRSEQPEDGYFNVLAIDGGGMRGIIPTEMLNRFEQITGMPISSKFDLVVGASAGTLIAGTLTAVDPKDGHSARYLAADMIDLFPSVAKDLFQMTISSFWNFAKNGFGLWGPVFPEGTFQNAAAKIVGNDPLSKCRTRRSFLAFDMTAGQPKVFNSQKAEQDRDLDCPASEAMAASSSVPILFPAGIVHYGDGSASYYADGGILGNNPAELAFTEAVNCLISQEAMCKKQPASFCPFNAESKGSKDVKSKDSAEVVDCLLSKEAMCKKQPALSCPFKAEAKGSEDLKSKAQSCKRNFSKSHHEVIRSHLLRIPTHKKIRILSLGCGKYPLSEPGEASKNWGILHWVIQGANKIVGGEGLFSDMLLRDIFPEQGKDQVYFRFDPTVSLFIFTQVMASNTYILNLLKQAGEKAANDPEFIKMCEIFRDS